MPSFNQQALNYRAQSANKVTVLVGSQPVAFAQTVGEAWDFGTQQLYGIGSRMPQEIQQLRVSPHITVDALALTANGALVLGYPSTLAQILADNEFNFFVNDGITQTTKFIFVGGVAGGFNENIATNQLITDAFTFMCADVLGPTGTSIVASSDAYTFPALATPVTGLTPGLVTNP